MFWCGDPLPAALLTAVTVVILAAAAWILAKFVAIAARELDTGLIQQAKLHG